MPWHFCAVLYLNSYNAQQWQWTMDSFILCYTLVTCMTCNVGAFHPSQWVYQKKSFLVWSMEQGKFLLSYKTLNTCHSICHSVFAQNDRHCLVECVRWNINLITELLFPRIISSTIRQIPTSELSPAIASSNLSALEYLEIYYENVSHKKKKKKLFILL